MTNVPEPSTSATCVDLTDALYAGAADPLIAAAVGLVCDIPANIAAQPGFAPYLQRSGSHAAINWQTLGAALLSGSDPVPLDRADRALLLIAVSIAGGPATHLRALLGQLDARRMRYVSGAFHLLAGTW